MSVRTTELLGDRRLLKAGGIYVSYLATGQSRFLEVHVQNATHILWEYGATRHHVCPPGDARIMGTWALGGPSFI